MAAGTDCSSHRFSSAGRQTERRLKDCFPSPLKHLPLLLASSTGEPLVLDSLKAFPGIYPSRTYKGLYRYTLGSTLSDTRSKRNHLRSEPVHYGDTCQPKVWSLTSWDDKVMSITSSLLFVTNFGLFPLLWTLNSVELMYSESDSPLWLTSVLPHTMWWAFASHPIIRFAMTY